MDKLDLSILRSNDRERLFEVWQNYKAGEPLEDADRIIAEIMDLHPEYYDYWNSTDFGYEFNPETDSVDPFLHIRLDEIAVNQINSNTPKQARFTYNKLKAKGYSHLEAIHKISFVIMEEIWDIMKFHQEFDENDYVRKLKNLK